MFRHAVSELETDHRKDLASCHVTLGRDEKAQALLGLRP